MPSSEWQPPPPGPSPSGSTTYYVNSWSARTSQRILARLVDSGFALGVIALVLVVGPHGRPVAQDLLIVALIAGFESLIMTRTGSTAGMKVIGIRVATIGRQGNPDVLTALRRSLPVTLCYPILVPGLFAVMVMPFALLTSIAFSPLRRGFHDRLSGTIVVQFEAPTPVTHASIATWWEPGTDAVMCRWGRVPGLFDRRRARAHRFDGAWWLVIVVMLATIASVGVLDVPMLWVWATLAWLIVATIDETWWLTAHGATPGHESAGYRVVDLTTGVAPSRGRAAARSIVLAPLLYVPPLQLILALWVHASALNRGPHDLIARTVVVDPDYEPPVFLPRPVPAMPTPGRVGATWGPPPTVRGPF